MRPRNQTVLPAARAIAGGVVLLLVLAAGLHAAEPLRWKLTAGEALRYELSQQTSMTLNLDAVGTHETSMTQSTTLRWTVEEVAEDGAAHIRLSVERVRLTKTDPEGFAYDSAGDADALQDLGVGLLIAGLYERLAEAEMRFVLTPQGEVRDFQAPEDLTQAFETFPAKRSLEETFSARGIQRLLLQWIPVLSTEELDEGQQWTHSAAVDMAGVEDNPTLETIYRYAGERQADGKTLAVLEPSVALQLTGEERSDWSIESQDSSGELLFDSKAGRLVSSRITQNVVLQRAISGQEQSQTIEQSIEAKLLPGE